MEHPADIVPTLMPLGDSALLLRFADHMDAAANDMAISVAGRLEAARLPGVVEIVPNLVSVLIRYDPVRIAYSSLCGEIRLLAHAGSEARISRPHKVAIEYGGEHGPDLATVASELGLNVPAFIKAHCAASLKVLAIGFAPGFVYCGMHERRFLVPRRETVRPSVPPGSVLFAARQTAISATTIPTGWAVIGRTRFINFDAVATPPTKMRAGDTVVFEAER